MVTILRLATESEELTIVRDQIGGPTCSRLIAVLPELVSICSVKDLRS